MGRSIRERQSLHEHGYRRTETLRATQENLGKAKSLKLNYGGIGTIKKTRKTIKPTE